MQRWAIAAALLGALCFASTVPAEFVQDDHAAIERNPALRRGLAAVLRNDFWGGAQTGNWRPVAQLSLFADARLSGMRPWVFHLDNVVLHALVCALFVFAFAGVAGERPAVLGALLAAVLAPGAEAVQAVVGRADLLATLFCLAALWLHRRGSAWAGAAWIMALGSKESAAVAPLCFLALDALVPPPHRSRRPWLGHAAAAVVYAAVRLSVVGAMRPVVQEMSNPLLLAPVPERVLGAGRVLIERYLWGALDPFRRLYDCSAFACGPARPADLLAWIGLGAAALILIAPLLLRRRLPEVAAALAWFAIFFLPLANLFVLGPSLYGERLFYLPGLGLALAVAACAERAALRLPVFTRAAFVTLAALHLFAVQLRNLDWRSDEALFPTGLALAPGSARVQTNAAVIAFREGRFAAAEEGARRAIAIWPGGTLDAWGVLGASLDQLGHAGEAGAAFARAFALGNSPLLAGQHATYLARQGRFAEAEVELQAALARDPDDRRLRALEAKVRADLAPPPR